MAGVSLSGLASGLRTDEIVTQLMQLEARPKTLLQLQQRQVTGRKTALEDVARQLRALTTAIGDLTSTLTWGNVQRVSSSDDTRVGARITGGAPTGTIEVNVLALARAAQATYSTTVPTGTLQLTTADMDDPSDPARQRTASIDLTGLTTMQEVVDKINATSASPVFAGIVNDRLTLTAKAAGATIAASDDTGALVPTATVAPLKTDYTINGQAQTRTTSSVVSPPGLPGVELTLKQAGAVTLTTTPPGPDLDKVKEKVKAFVSAYNASLDLLRTKLTEKPLKTPTTDLQFAVGALRGETALQSLVTNLRTAIQPAPDTTTGVVDALAEIGIAVPRASSDGRPTPDALAGKLAVDEGRLLSVLQTNPDAVRSILGVGGATGLAQRLTAALDPVAKTATGYLARSQETADRRFQDLGTRITDFDRRLAAREARMRAQFTAMEQALNQSQTTTSWLNGQLAGMQQSRG
jgi:flagellar hook-associated protein 2